MRSAMTESTVEIVTYRPELAEDFARLNREWLEKYFTVEPLDEEYLSDPEGHIMQPGGEIFFAVDGDRVIGTCAAIPREDGTIELAKLAVTPAAQGRGLGRALSVAVIEFARSRQPKCLYLVSSSRLSPALRLYETLGFRHLPFPWPAPYTDADVYMELDVSRPSTEATR
jgi:ribosomal protein S18 acetylase RimI-like enzyme